MSLPADAGVDDDDERPVHAWDPGFRELVAARLAAFPVVDTPHAEGHSAAVAFTLVPTRTAAAEVGFLLTKRAGGMRKHPGQWALPGGREDPGESAEEAALRELHEELGVALADDAVLGRLDDYVTRSGFVITPVVVWAGDVELAPNPREVARAYRVPLGLLDRPGSPRFVAIPESDRPVIQMPLMATLIHAPTAAILYQAREVLLHGEPTRVAHLEQPVWAWR